MGALLQSQQRGGRSGMLEPNRAIALTGSGAACSWRQGSGRGYPTVSFG